MIRLRHAGLALAAGLLLPILGCGGSSTSTPIRAIPYVGDYAGFLMAASNHELVPGDRISVANDWGGYHFRIARNVTNVRITIIGAGGSQGGSFGGGTGGTGTFDLSPNFFLGAGSASFWVVLGEGGRPSAGEVGLLADYMSFNGGGAATDWHAGEDTYVYAGGGGGGSDVRLEFAGDPNDPHAMVDPCASAASRIAVVGGGGGATDNTDAFGGFGGGFNSPGGDGAYTPYGSGATTTSGGSLGGTLCQGGSGLQDGTEGWAGGGGGGYYGGGAPTAHGGGGGGSGFLLGDTWISLVSTSDGVQGGNLSTTLHGAFTIVVD